MSDRFVCIITIRDYNTDAEKRDFADRLMERYGYDRMNVSEIRYTDKRIEFKIRTEDADEVSFEWMSHDR